MRTTYSQFLSLLYDQAAPVGSLGRGTHYSVLRAVSWRGVDLAPLSEAVFHDFAVIWDEDHDERITIVVERIYLAGLLSPVLAIGERKGCLTVLVSAEAVAALGPRALKKYEQRLRSIATRVDGDDWSVVVCAFDDDSPIIDSSKDEIRLYLASIDLLWRLGSKEIESAEAD